MKTNNNTVLITGGSSGIGATLAKRLSELGNRVIVCARNEDRLAQIKSRIPSIQTKACDIQDLEQIEALKDDIGSEVNLLINNAGIVQELSLHANADLGAQIKEVDINLNGILRMLHVFLPSMQNHTTAAVVNVTSATAFIAESKAPIYSATKAAQHALTLALRHQLRDTQVKVFELIPPLTDTPMAAHVEGISKLSPDKVASALIAGLEKDQYEIAPGLSRAARLMSRVAPRFAFSQLNK
ncbi:SDR family NAD(P)-dependent oxidoreductase [uncultured Roseobacter sp.]|uniref:SDR family oxidoreductase n=1 Tax=uncultured Roseobacter sp. TaxID=114847 RepID=UPI00260A7711|nr:SDR family NAD(P)-dependent oxidoreductase [uncultured Roseobacter sp.]